MKRGDILRTIAAAPILGTLIPGASNIACEVEDFPAASEFDKAPIGYSHQLLAPLESDVGKTLPWRTNAEWTDEGGIRRAAEWGITKYRPFIPRVAALKAALAKGYAGIEILYRPFGERADGSYIVERVSLEDAIGRSTH